MKMQFLCMTVGGVYEGKKSPCCATDTVLFVSANKSVCNSSGSGHVKNKKAWILLVGHFIVSAIDKR